MNSTSSIRIFVLFILVFALFMGSGVLLFLFVKDSRVSYLALTTQVTVQLEEQAKLWVERITAELKSCYAERDAGEATRLPTCLEKRMDRKSRVPDISTKVEVVIEDGGLDDASAAEGESEDPNTKTLRAYLDHEINQRQDDMALCIYDVKSEKIIFYSEDPNNVKNPNNLTKTEDCPELEAVKEEWVRKARDRNAISDGSQVPVVIAEFQDGVDDLKASVIRTIFDLIDNIHTRLLNIQDKSLLYAIAPIMIQNEEKGYMVFGNSHAKTMLSELMNMDTQFDGVILVIFIMIGGIILIFLFFQLKRQQEAKIKRGVYRFVSAYAHALKDPLTIIRLHAQSLADDKKSVKERADYRSRIETATMRINRAVDVMQDLASLETRRKLQSKEKGKPVAIGELIRKVEKEKGALVTQKNLTVDLSQVEGNLEVRGGPFLAEDLYNVIDNLVKNAIEWTPTKGKVVISANVQRGRVCITVQNEGPRIHDDDRKRVFDPFFSRKLPGVNEKRSGLGLHLVKDIATQYKGDVRLKNVQGGVLATFSIRIESGLGG
tara:strand:- start:397 stop:2040 length:1644 start_codon:yes stop_codon:yes gene_type:complete